MTGFRAIRDMDKGGRLARHWEIADYKQNYESHLLTPLDVANSITMAIERGKAEDPQRLFLAAHDAKDLLAQARQSARR